VRISYNLILDRQAEFKLTGSKRVIVYHCQNFSQLLVLIAPEKKEESSDRLPMFLSRRVLAFSKGGKKGVIEGAKEPRTGF